MPPKHNTNTPVSNGNGNGNGARKTKAKSRRLRRNKLARSMGIMSLPGQTIRNPIGQNRFHGSDFLQTINLPASLTTGNAVLVNFPVSPGRLIGTRIGLLARAFDKYRFTRVRVRYVPSVPVTVGGQIILYFDLDAKDTLLGASSVEVMVRDAMAHQGAVMAVVNQPASVDLPNRPGLRDFFTGESTGNDQLYYQARLWVVGVAGLNGTGAPTSGTVGSLYVDYDVQFMGEQMQELASPDNGTLIASALTDAMQIASGSSTTLSVTANTAVVWAGKSTGNGYTTSSPEGVYTAATGLTGPTLGTVFPYGLTRSQTNRYIFISSGGYGIFIAANAALGAVAQVDVQFAAFNGTPTGAWVINPVSENTALLMSQLLPPPVALAQSTLLRQVAELQQQIGQLHLTPHLRFDDAKWLASQHNDGICGCGSGLERRECCPYDELDG